MIAAHRFPCDWYTVIRLEKAQSFTREGRWVGGGVSDPVEVLIAPAGTREGEDAVPSQLARDVIEIYAAGRWLDADVAGRVRVEDGPYRGVWEIEGTPAWWPKGTHLRARRVNGNGETSRIRSR